jgi:hypothetical protein
MAENPRWIVLGKFWSQITKHTRPGGPEGTGRRCEAGHLMDPNWETCPYCEAEKRAREKTLHGAAPVSGIEPIQRSSTMTRNPTMTPGMPQNHGRSGTRVDTSPDVVSSEARDTADLRKLTGVLVTFSWKPQGELFPLREGRNVIGSGTVESEGGRPCDVRITTDPMLSNEHAVILCRNGRYEVFDRQSTNGSFLNDKFVEGRGAAIQGDRAKIKTGSTVWTFLRIEGGAPAATVGSPTVDSPDLDPDSDEPRSSSETRVR